MNKKTKIILHCSDSTFGNAALINEWHRQRGFLLQQQGVSIGYNLVILNGWFTPTNFNERYDGHIETGRGFDSDNHIETWEHGAHTKGENFSSLGICLIGKSGKFSDMQLSTLRKELRQLYYQFNKAVEVQQHSDFDKNKPFCAGFSEKQMRELRRVVL